ncbi:MAG TPA: hypothetical protein VI258_02270 [Rhodanobacteraceae bacterium]
MDAGRLAFRRQIIEAHGGRGAAAEQALAYCDKPFGDVPCPSFPLADEPHIATWTAYASEAAAEGAFAALRRHFVQLRVPIRAGISQDAAYLDATRKGRPAAADEEYGPGLTLARPDRLTLEIRETIAGRLPILVAGERADFVALVQAFTGRNEPVDVPPAMGACIVNGLNNWDRVAAYRSAWERDHQDDAAAGGWSAEFKRFAAHKELYQDRLIILSRGPYSAIDAASAGLNEAEWLDRSVVIRREHECTHYFTYRVFASMRNNVFDELIADFVGLVRAFGGYRGELARRFLGLESYPAIRSGSRLDVYRADLSDESLAVVASLAVAATRNLQAFANHNPALVADLPSLARATYALSLLTLEELASPEMRTLTGARIA